MSPTETQNKLHYALYRYLNSSAPDETTAKEIAQGYHELPQILQGIKTVRQTIRPKRFELAAYIKSPYYKTLKTLEQFINKELAPYLDYFFIHGSIATMDWAEGFSDLDTYLFVKKEVCENPSQLKTLNALLAKGREILKKIDPLSHHGFIGGSSVDLMAYPGVYMPPPVFRHAKTLYGSDAIVFYLRDSEKEYRDSFFRFSHIVSDEKRFGENLADPVEFKYFVAVLLLIPTLYLQALGKILYKKYSFALVKHPFLEKLSAVRARFWKHTIAELKTMLGHDYFAQSQAMLKEIALKVERAHEPRVYTNPPQPLPIELYDAARRELTECFSAMPDIAALYEYGSVRAPGISDLDLIVVTKGNLEHSLPEDYRITPERFPAASKVALGTLMVMRRDDFAEIERFDSVELKKIFGEEIERAPLTQQEETLREKASIVDWLPERLTRLLALVNKPELDAQYTLRYILSFAFTLERISRLTGDLSYGAFTAEVKDARREWLDGNTTDLYRLIRRAIFIGFEALRHATLILFADESGPEGTLLLLPWQRIVLTNNEAEIDPDLAVAFARPDLATVPVSAKLVAHFLTLSRENNLLAEEMRKNLRVQNAEGIRLADPAYENFLKTKMALAGRYAKYLKQNGFTSGLYRFGFYFKP